MSTLDTPFTVAYAHHQPHTQAVRADRATAAPTVTGVTATAPLTTNGERDRDASRAERSRQRRKDAARRERAARWAEQLERSRDNAAARHPLGLR